MRRETRGRSWAIAGRSGRRLQPRGSDLAVLVSCVAGVQSLRPERMLEHKFGHGCFQGSLRVESRHDALLQPASVARNSPSPAC